jgi:branched-chain amino acid transport system substrate-binding protein
MPNINRRSAIAGLAATTAAAAFAIAAPAGAQQKPPIKIGHIAIMTGPAGAYGQLQKIIVDIAVEDINAAGGVNGSKVEVQTEDSQLDPAQAVLLFRKLYGAGAVAVVGPMSGTQWETVSPLANQMKFPAITANASKPGITVKPWTIRLGPADDTVVPQGIAAFLKKYPNVKNIVITADVREASGKAAAELYQQAAKAHNLKVLDTVEFSTRTTDVSPIALKIKSLNPDAVFAVALIPQGLLLAKEFAIQGFTKPVLANSIIWPGNFVSAAGEAGKNWHTIGYSTNSKVPGDNERYKSVAARFIERARKTPALGTNISNNTVAYDIMMLYADILKRRGVDGSTDVAKARDIIREEFEKLKEFRSLNIYKMRDTGDGDMPHELLVPDVAKKEWKFAD